jgi:hypothetical protein
MESKAWTGGKQQLTATRLHELLVGEGHHVGTTLVSKLSLSTPPKSRACSVAIGARTRSQQREWSSSSSEFW